MQLQDFARDAKLKLHSAKHPEALPIHGGGLGGGDVRQIAARDLRVSEISSIRKRRNEHEDLSEAKKRLAGIGCPSLRRLCSGTVTPTQTLPHRGGGLLRGHPCIGSGIISGLPARGLLLVVATAVGWGLGWPMMKIAMHDWPPLFARGCAGLAAALGLAIIALVRGQNLLPSRSLAPRLALGAATNVFAAMGLTALALLWLTVAQAALLTFSMPIWAMLLAWPILGERPRLRSVIALCLGVAGLVLLMGPNLGGGIETFPGVALALAAAVLFALGAVTSRAPIPLPPMVSTAWLVGLGSAQ